MIDKILHWAGLVRMKEMRRLLLPVVNNLENADRKLSIANPRVSEQATALRSVRQALDILDALRNS